MKSRPHSHEIDAAQLSDEELVVLANRRDEAAVRVLTRRHNRRLFRMARSIVRNDNEAEDIVQETYVRAFTHLGQFRAEASFSTWLTRIALNEAMGRVRRQRSVVEWTDEGERQIEAEIIQFPTSAVSDPERSSALSQIRRLLESAIDGLPDGFRTVFVARIVEGMSIEATAELLGLRPQTVKTRLHRARLLLRKELDDQLGSALVDTFPFAGARCDRMTEAIIHRLGLGS